MNQRSRAARNIVKARRAAARDHKAGRHTLASHAIQAGLDESTASGVAGALRAKAKQIGVTGFTTFMVRRTEGVARPVKGGRRFTVSQFRTLVQAYKPRAARFVEARAALLSY